MKVATTLVLLTPGPLVHVLEAHAAVSGTLPRRVEIGKRYQLTSDTILHGHCPGCGDSSLPALKNAMLRLKIVAEGREQEIVIAGDARFVSPVTGVLKFVKVEPLTPEQARPYQEKCPGVTFSGAEVSLLAEEIAHE